MSILDCKLISGDVFCRKTGLLIIQNENEKGALEESQESMDQYNMPYKLLSSDELTAQYPTIKGTSGYKGLLDIDAGLLLPSRCLIAVQVIFLYI